MFKILNAESKTIVNAAAIVGILSFASRVVGLIRDRILAGEFGAGDTLDVYYAAFKLPDLILSLTVVGALSASFIPLFTKHFYGVIGHEKAWRFTNNVLHILLVIMLGVSAVAFIWASPLASLLAPGFSAIKQEGVAQFLRVILVAEMIMAISMIFGSALQSMKRFYLFSLAPIFYNIGIIIGALWLVDLMGLIGLAWGVALGSFFHLLVQFYGVLQAGYRYHPVWDIKDKDTREMFRLMGPRVLGLGLTQINSVFFTIIASTLAVGSITVFQFAYNIQFFPVGIIGVAFAIAAFPSLSEHVFRKDQTAFISTISSTVRQIIFLLVPMTTLFLVMRAQIVRVVVGAGQFDWAATILTADTLAFFAFTFVIQSLIFVLARAFFALHDTVTPLVAGIVSTAIGLITALWLSEKFGVIGLGMAFSLAAIVNLTLLWVPLRQRTGSLDEAHIVRSLYVVTAAGFVGAAVTQLLKPVVVSFISLDTFWGVLSQGLIAGGAGLLIYFVVAFVLKSEELNELLSGLRRRFIQKATPEETISTTPSS